ncbi:hypothetical protein BV22DRAFT_1100455 [Leucogyrophana mollusca]|uniref:Uncharacterized protein n=1 Tax=Leucogyrophana mollusca TaxID=85980 RepID=A0ACB8AYH6_9AGAM|nr:hypothetical protein BV22DRAFT_1100455 [Leucogyrophana mollusca]
MRMSSLVASPSLAGQGGLSVLEHLKKGPCRLECCSVCDIPGFAGFKHCGRFLAFFLENLVPSHHQCICPPDESLQRGIAVEGYPPPQTARG